MQLPLRGAAWVVACALFASGAAAQTEPAAPADPAPRRGVRPSLRAHVSQSYTSNLFHEQSRRLRLFEEGADRYRGMEGPSDFVTEPGLDAGVTFKLGKRRRLSFELGGSYAIHARNAIANHASLAAEARYRFGKRDSLRYQAGLVPSRFVKNYPYDGVPALGQTYYAHAYRLELGNELLYRHAWTKRVRSELGVAMNLKRFDAPFENRDCNEYAARLASAYSPWRALQLELAFELGITRTPRGLEYREIDDERAFIPVDRSHHDLEPQLEAVFDLPSRFEASLGFGLRLREFETAERRDDSYHDRRDVRLTLDAELRKGFGRRFEVAVQAQYQDNAAHRVDPGDDADEYGFEELTLGLGLAFVLD